MKSYPFPFLSLSFIVLQVCHKWYALVYEGSLWKTLDISPFYKTIPSDHLLKLGLAAGNFLKIANFR
jgi:hypothetical protein